VEDATPGEKPARNAEGSSRIPAVGSPEPGASQPPGASRRRRRVVGTVAVVVVLVFVYAAVVTLYALSGSVRSFDAKEPEPEKGGVTVVLTVEGIDAARQRADMTAYIDPSDTLFTGDGLALGEDIHVIISPIEGSQTLSFKADSAIGTKPIRMLADGEIGTWPFDHYDVDDLVVLAYVTTDGVSRPIPTTVWMKGDVPGWSASVAQKTKAPPELPASLSEAISTAPLLEFSASRSASTVAFAFVLLALLVVMPCLVLFVAITAFRGRRKLEASFMGWMGAMLFATIPLRTFLPGSPPIGSWIDFTVVLWVVTGLIAGLAIYVAAWARWAHSEPGASSSRAP
jgi:hypothetical protein